MSTHPKDDKSPKSEPETETTSSNESDDDEWADAQTVQMPAVPDPDKKD